MIDELISLVRNIYTTDDFIPLHVPEFVGNEKDYVTATIDSTFVSSVGKFVTRFEEQLQGYTGAKRAVATCNGTTALYTALYLSDVRAGDLVITQALSFVATCNALHMLGAQPVFADVDADTLGLSPEACDAWLTENAKLGSDGQCYYKATGAAIKAILPMHTFGHPVRLDELQAVCDKWHLTMIEDAAESLGSTYKGQHTGTFGRFGAVSFNGNKVITTGGGGMLLCKTEADGQHARHVTTTAKQPHPYEFYHDEPGFNFRLPNLNAALGCAQMEQLDVRLASKRKIAATYEEFFAGSDYRFVKEPDYAQSNYWLNAIYCPDKSSRDNLLKTTNKRGIMTRPIWQLMHRLPMYTDCIRGPLPNSEEAEAHIVNLPSSPLLKASK